MYNVLVMMTTRAAWSVNIHDCGVGQDVENCSILIFIRVCDEVIQYVSFHLTLVGV